MTFIGLDLHKRYITLCALDDADAVLAELRPLPVALEAITEILATLPAPISIRMEATLYWHWLHEHLEPLGHTVCAADARRVKLIWQAPSKTDPIDARKLAELLRVNIFPAVWMPDADTRRRRTLLHGRAFLVRQRTQVRNRIHAHLTTETLLYPQTDLYGRGGRVWLTTAPLSPPARRQVEHSSGSTMRSRPRFPHGRLGLPQHSGRELSAPGRPVSCREEPACVLDAGRSTGRALPRRT
jgi:transposase